MHINIQPIEKLSRHAGDSLDVHSIFYTIQGEGPFAGRPAVFVRLAGCNLQCPGCDTEYTSGRKTMTVEEICAAIAEVVNVAVGQMVGQPLVVVTGGEPFRQPITPMVRALAEVGFDVQIETNGTLPLPDQFEANSSVRLSGADKRLLYLHWARRVYVVCSPKTHHVHPEVYKIACAFKYVVDTQNGTDISDGIPSRALDNPSHYALCKPREGAMVYIQPRDEQDDEINSGNLRLAINTCMKFGYTLQLQIHKILNLE